MATLQRIMIKENAIPQGNVRDDSIYITFLKWKKKGENRLVIAKDQELDRVGGVRERGGCLYRDGLRDSCGEGDILWVDHDDGYSNLHK